MLILKVISRHLHHNLLLSIFRFGLLLLCLMLRLCLPIAIAAAATTDTMSLVKLPESGKQLHIDLVGKLNPLLQNSDRLFCLLEALVLTVHLLG